MYLIFTETFDYSTNNALKWFSFFGKEVFCIDNKTEIKVTIEDINNPVFMLNGTAINLQEIEGVWFRRSRLKIQYLEFSKLKGTEENLKKYHKAFKLEVEDYLNFLLFKGVNSVGNPDLLSVNKLRVLLIAKKEGFLIPKTHLADSDDINSFSVGNDKIITKLLIPFPRKINGKEFRLLTYPFKSDSLDEDFSLSLFQKRIEKKIEVRVFYLKGNCFAKAIFSQKDKQTTEDYRNYNVKKPNRIVPFELPKKICKKLKRVMEQVGLDTGSIDFIVDKNNLFIFLEINPIGQFADFYYQCNFPLEKEVVKTLL